MKGMEQLLSSMIGVDPKQLNNMIVGMVDNAAYMAEAVKRIEENQKIIADKLGVTLVSNNLQIERENEDG